MSFITASSYLRGPGFIGMREVMRRTFDEIWILDLEGDNLGARKTENVFAIQNPVAIAVGVRYGDPRPDVPATVHYGRITGTRSEKLAALAEIGRFSDVKWQDCFSGWPEPFLPKQSGDYFSWPLVTDLFPWQHSGVQWKRTWPVAHSREALEDRWKRLVGAGPVQKATLFRETSARRIEGSYQRAAGLDPDDAPDPLRTIRDADESNLPSRIRFGYRSLDRQWALSDSRLSDRPRPPLWAAHSDRQVYMTSLLTGVLGLGPAATVAADVPDLHHFRGSYGGKDVIPLWRDRAASQPNVAAGLLSILSARLAGDVSPEDLFAYAYAVLAAPGYVERFSEELTIPGPRLPLTGDQLLFRRSVALGRRLVNLHTYGSRMGGSDGDQALSGAARCTTAVPEDASRYPGSVSYDAVTSELHVGDGVFKPVGADLWEFSVSGFRPVQSWIGYRLAEGAGRRSSALDDIRPSVWTAEMTEELLELLWTVEETCAMQPQLNAVLDEIAHGDLIPAADLPTPTDAERRPPAQNSGDSSAALTFDLG